MAMPRTHEGVVEAPIHFPGLRGAFPQFPFQGDASQDPQEIVRGGLVSFHNRGILNAQERPSDLPIDAQSIGQAIPPKVPKLVTGGVRASLEALPQQASSAQAHDPPSRLGLDLLPAIRKNTPPPIEATLSAQR